MTCHRCREPIAASDAMVWLRPWPGQSERAGDYHLHCFLLMLDDVAHPPREVVSDELEDLDAGLAELGSGDRNAELYGKAARMVFSGWYDDWFVLQVREELHKKFVQEVTRNPPGSVDESGK